MNTTTMTKMHHKLVAVTEERDRLAAELAKLRGREAKQKPVAMVDAGDDGYFAEILPDCSVGVGDMLYAFPPLNADPVLWQQSFDQWWDAHGQYLRAGGGQYEKTFAYHAWEAAAAFYAAPVPAVAAPAVLDMHKIEDQLLLAETEMLNAKAWAAGNQSRTHVGFAMTAISFARALLQSAPQSGGELVEAGGCAPAVIAAPAVPAPSVPYSCLNSWFLSLPDGRQAILHEDKWMLANAAFEAGRAMLQSAEVRHD